MATKVLIVFSWNDFVSRNRYDIMLESPLLKGFEIFECFAVGSPHVKTTAKKLFAHLKGQVAKKKPEIVLLNAGVAFMENPYVFIEAFQMLKKAYPKLRFGIERQSSLVHFYSGLGLFEESDDMTAIVELFFYTVFNRKV